LTGKLVPAGLLVLLTFAAYSSAVQGGFIWDDDDYVTENVHLRSVEGLGRIWSLPPSIPQYYPLVHTTYWIEHHLWGLEPLGYHLVNVLLHAGAAILAWLVLLRLRIPGALVAAAVFALHPVQVESVAWITERKNVLSGLLYLAAMLAYFRFEPPESDRERGGKGFYVLALVLFAGALLSKSVTSSLPAAILLIFWWKRGRLRWRDLWPLVPFFVLGVVAGWHTGYLEREHVGAMGPEWDIGFVERFLIAGRAVWFYLGKLVWPWPLIFFYPRWEIDAGVWWQYVFPLTAIGLVVSLWLQRARFGRGPLVAILFFGGTLFPALGFFDVYPMRYSFVADHFQYLASLGPIALAVGAATIVFRARGMNTVGAGVAIAVVLALGGLTWRQGHVYESLRTLWEDVVVRNPDAWVAQNHLGKVLLEEGNPEAAEPYIVRALELKPDHAEASSNLASIRIRQQRYAEARRLLERAVADEPRLSEAHGNLGSLCQLEGDLPGAERHFRRALEIKPDNAPVRVNLARLLLGRQAVAEAIEHLRAAVFHAPDLPEARLDLGRALLATGALDEAAIHLDRALALRPGWPAARAARAELDARR